MALRQAFQTDLLNFGVRLGGVLMVYALLHALGQTPSRAEAVI
jgi:aminoglycoside N3'-acetyltransferase